MNALEMHIDVDLEAQKIGSSALRKFTDDEIDWLLNREVDRFIKDRIKKDQDSLGFEATEVDLDSIRTLIVNDQVLPVRKQAVTDRTVFAWLPGDYSYLVDDFSIVLQACNNKEYRQGMNFTTSNEYLYVYPINATTLSGAGPFYQSYILKVNGTAVLSAATMPGTTTPDELFTFVDNLMNQLWSLDNGNVTYYWERYGKYYKRGCLIVVSGTRYTLENSISIDGSAPSNATEVIQSYIAAPLIIPADIDERDPVPNRLIKGSARSQVLKSAFAKSRASSPVSSVDGNLLRAYHDTSFIVNSLIISYIRKPRKISLALNTDCDLPEEFHSQIVDRTVTSMKRLTMNPDWQAALQDMMLNKG